MTLEERLSHLEQSVASLLKNDSDLRAARIKFAGKGDLPVGGVEVTAEGVRFTLESADLPGLRVQIETDADGSRLMLMGPLGLPRLMLSVSQAGEPRLTLTDSAGKRRVVLGMNDEDPILVFFDANEKPSWVAP